MGNCPNCNSNDIEIIRQIRSFGLVNRTERNVQCNYCKRKYYVYIEEK